MGRNSGSVWVSKIPPRQGLQIVFARPHAVARVSDRPASARISNTGGNRQGARVDDGVCLIIRGAEPDPATTCVDVAPLEVVPDFDAAGHLTRHGIDTG